MNIEELRGTLEDWAEFYLDPGRGFPHSTVLYRAMKGTFFENSNFVSCLPNDVESSERDIREIERRMARLLEKGLVTEMEAVQCYYKAWAQDKEKPVRSAAWKVCVLKMGMSKSTFFRWKDKGERALLNTYRVY